MIQHFFTVGPSQLHPNYTHWMQQAFDAQLGSISHRSATFNNIYKQADEHLRALMNIPASHSIFFLPSATEVWERIIANTVSRHSAHLVSGAFGKKFYEFSQALGKQAQLIGVPHGQGFEQINTLSLHPDTELICTTHNETASGVQLPLAHYATLKQQYPNALLCTDIVSSAPYANIDFTIVDSAFFSVQKAFGLPAGLGVWIANEACINKSTQAANKGAHHTLEQFAKNYKNWETPSTPNVVNIFLLSKVAEAYNKIGINAIRQQVEDRAKILYQLGEQKQSLANLVTTPAIQSQTVVVYNTTQAGDIISNFKQSQIILGSGYGSFKHNNIRIANFPSITEQSFDILINKLNQLA
jgi:phosphoserine aminotransferase